MQLILVRMPPTASTMISSPEWITLHSSIPAILLLIVFYVGWIAHLRKENDRYLETVAVPTTPSEAHPIAVRFLYSEFPLIAIKALEFGLFKTYGIPSISALLVRTGELVEKCPRRYDDTDLIMREFLEHEPNSPRAKAAMVRLNWLHGQYTISNRDYLYVLCVFIVEPIDWVERFGYRAPHWKEKVAMHLRFKDMGEKMKFTDIPSTYEKALEYLQDYEEKYMVYANTNAKVGLCVYNLSFCVYVVLFLTLALLHT
jgi:hypothetical protein